MATENLSEIREAFRGLILRDLRPVEDRDGVRVGEDVRIHKDAGKGFVVRFLKGTDEKRRKAVREKLETADVEYTEGKDFKD
jgi:hypothetical protein